MAQPKPQMTHVKYGLIFDKEAANKRRRFPAVMTSTSTRSQEPCKYMPCLNPYLPRSYPAPCSARSIHARDRPRPLRHNFACIELNKHCSVRLEILDRHGQAEVVQDEELEL